jgi:hypothetical protein
MSGNCVNEDLRAAFFRLPGSRFILQSMKFSACLFCVVLSILAVRPAGSLPETDGNVEGVITRRRHGRTVLTPLS